MHFATNCICPFPDLSLVLTAWLQSCLALPGRLQQLLVLLQPVGAILVSSAAMLSRLSLILQMPLVGAKCAKASGAMPKCSVTNNSTCFVTNNSTDGGNMQEDHTGN